MAPDILCRWICDQHVAHRVADMTYMHNFENQFFIAECNSKMSMMKYSPQVTPSSLDVTLYIFDSIFGVCWDDDDSMILSSDVVILTISFIASSDSYLTAFLQKNDINSENEANLKNARSPAVHMVNSVWHSFCLLIGKVSILHGIRKSVIC